MGGRDTSLGQAMALGLSVGGFWPGWGSAGASGFLSLLDDLEAAGGGGNSGPSGEGCPRTTPESSRAAIEPTRSFPMSTILSGRHLRGPPQGTSRSGVAPGPAQRPRPRTTRVTETGLVRPAHALFVAIPGAGRYAKAVLVS